jgi:hypothetical protein
MILAVAQVKKDELVTKNAASPGAETSVTIEGKNIWIYYHAPSARGRRIFGGDGALEPFGKVWRLGADYATVLHTGADLDLNGLAIPKGDYTLYVDLDNGQWKLIVNKTLMDGGRHIWGVGVSPDGIHEGSTTDNPATELGRAFKSSAFVDRRGFTSGRPGADPLFALRSVFKLVHISGGVEAFIGAYLTATLEFAQMASDSVNPPTRLQYDYAGKPYTPEQLQYFAEVSASIMGVEAEHRVLGRVIGEIDPPHNLNYEQTDGLTSVYNGSMSAVAALTPFLGPGTGLTAYSLSQAVAGAPALVVPTTGGLPPGPAAGSGKGR